MDFDYRRTYRGPVKLVILDWAGTTIDYGCYAPAVVFVQVYKRKGLEISMEQARVPMGLHKRDHIRAISQMEEVAAAWTEHHGRPVTEEDVEVMFADFQPLHLAVRQRPGRLLRLLSQTEGLQSVHNLLGLGGT